MQSIIIFSFLSLLLSASFVQAGTSSTSESTSTTSGSIKRIFVKTDAEKLSSFVAQNYDRLQEAAAQGSGAILDDYIALLGCLNPNNRMGLAIQKNFQHLFAGSEAQLVERTTYMIEGEVALTCESQS